MLSFLTCRHLRGRLAGAACTQATHPTSDSATSLPHLGAVCSTPAREEAAPALPVTSSIQETGPAAAPQAEDPAADAPASRPEEGARQGRDSRSSESSSSGLSSEEGGGAGDRQGCGVDREGGRPLGSARYFRRKRAAWLTGWWESAAAFGAVCLLPIVSVVPCSTTAERDDEDSGE